jgi:hypothetical protein
MRRGTIVDRLSAALSGADCFGSVDASYVMSVEQTLNVRFPRSYRVFLELFGAALIPSSLELYGLPDSRAADDSPPYWTNILDVVPQYRNRLATSDDRRAFPVSHGGCDTVFLLDPAEKTIEDEYAVIAIGPGVEHRMISHTFVDFVRLVANGPPESNGA